MRGPVLTTVLLAAVIIAVGARLSDGVRLKQEEAILHKLPLPEAHAYYELLRRRARRTRLLRAVTVAALLVTIMAVRRHFFHPPAPPAPPSAAALLSR